MEMNWLFFIGKGPWKKLCGIIIRAGERLLGIGAQSLGEENVDREELEGIIPGVWERKID